LFQIQDAPPFRVWKDAQADQILKCRDKDDKDNVVIGISR